MRLDIISCLQRHLYRYLCLYIYIYIQRERKREEDSMICAYIHIYIYSYIHICIYEFATMHIDAMAERARSAELLVFVSKMCLRSTIVDCVAEATIDKSTTHTHTNIAIQYDECYFYYYCYCCCFCYCLISACLQIQCRLAPELAVSARARRPFASEWRLCQ